MKKEQREIYHILAGEIGYLLCSFCKYAVALGYCGDGGDIECEHPLFDSNDREKQVLNAMDLGDCWGFRPRHPVDFVADVVGMVLANGWNGGVTWWQEDTGEWLIAGVKE